MRTHYAVSSLLAAGLVVLACAALCPAAGKAARKSRGGKPPVPAPAREVVYKSTKNADGSPVALKLHVYAPAGHKATDRRTAAVFFFGGGWTGGSPAQFYPHCAYLASRGVLAMAAEYRVKGRNGTTPYECAADGKSAIRYVRAHAGELGVDPARIIAGGGSAGGHVAAATGTLSGLDEPAEDANVSSRPDAMVLFNPVINCGPQGGYGYRQVGARYQEICPTHNVTKAVPPTIVLHGRADKTVPYADAEGFAKAMAAAGARCELVGYDGQGHGFFNFGRGGNDNFIATVEAADRFLASLGFLKGDPAVKPFVAALAGPAPE